MERTKISIILQKSIEDLLSINVNQIIPSGLSEKNDIYFTNELLKEHLTKAVKHLECAKNKNEALLNIE